MSYLAPSIPAEFFELAAKAISNEAGIEVDLQFEQRISEHFCEPTWYLASDFGLLGL
jgi:hypothetical protein